MTSEALVPHASRALSPAKRLGLFGGALAVLVATAAIGGATASLVVMVGVFGISSLAKRRARGEITAYDAQVVRIRAALDDGQLDDAERFFWRWAEQTSSERVAASARVDLGAILILRGDHDRAASVLADNARRHAAELHRARKTATNAMWLALAHALRGATDDAKPWVALAIAATPTTLFGAYIASIIRCRTGETAAAARALADHWTSFEATLIARDLRSIRIVRAFAVSGDGPRAAGPAAAILEGLRPSYPGEFTFLGAAWPEMATFLAAHDLAG